MRQDQKDFAVDFELSLLHTMTNTTFTVMGPDSQEGPASTLSPPRFDDGSDKLSWRESVKDWNDNVLARAAGGDTRAKGIAACMGLTLYRSLPPGAKEQVKQSLRSGEIILTPSEPAGPEVQTEIVKKILDTVAKDTAVDRIARMVRLNTQVHKCVRKGSETLKEFVNRFKIPSFAYLNIVKADYHSSESQIFAMTLIINAKLGEQLFANTVSTLINGTKNPTDAKESYVAIRKTRLEKLIEAVKNGRSENNEELEECMKVITAAVEAYDKTDEDDEKRGFISLADAFDALESISLEQRSLNDSADKPHNDTITASGLMGGPNNYENRDRGNTVHRGWSNRYRGGYNQGPNRGRQFPQRSWRGREGWTQRRTDLREDIEKKRMDRTDYPESRNDEKFKKRARHNDNNDGQDEPYGGQIFH